jgi:hypothetical protein
MRYAKPRKYTHVSRYSVYRQIIDDNNNQYTETANQYTVDEESTDIYHEVQNEEENRLDIISNKYYNTPDYYWVIAMANDLVDPFIIKVGDVLRIPSIYSLYHWGGALFTRV